MADYDYQSRQVIAKAWEAKLEKRIKKLQGPDQELAKRLAEGKVINLSVFREIYGEVLTDCVERPSLWFESGHKGLLDVFVPEKYQKSYLHIIDKLPRFPFPRGYGRRCMRTDAYEPQFFQIFFILKAYWNLFFCDESLETYLLGQLDAERLDYVRNQYYFEQHFSYLYAAELDLGNQAVIDALQDVILSENNTSYLSREMILGILRSDHKGLHDLLCKLLLAARLQEGLRQSICESMDFGTPEVFLQLLQVIEEHDLIRFSAVKRAVSTWIGIFDENSVDRISQKLLTYMGNCLRDQKFCREQLQTEDAVAINTALWAIGFYEVKDAVAAMKELIDHGTRHQKLAASFYNRTVYDEDLQIKAAKKVILEHTEDLELVTAYMPAFEGRWYSWLHSAFEQGNHYSREPKKPKDPILTSYYEDREEAEAFYQCFYEILSHLPKKGLSFEPFIFPWYQSSLTPTDILCQLAFLAYLLQDEAKITETASRLGEIQNRGRDTLLNLLLYEPTSQAQRELVIQYMGNANTSTSDMAIQIVKKMTIKEEEYILFEQMLRFKRSDLRTVLIEFLMKQKEEALLACVQRLLTDKKEEKRSAGLDILLRLSKDQKKAALYQQARSLVTLVAKPTDKEKIMIQELQNETSAQTTREDGYGIYNRQLKEELLCPLPADTSLTLTKKELLQTCMPVTKKKIAELYKKLDRLFQTYKDYEYISDNGQTMLLGNEYWPLQTDQKCTSHCYGKPLEAYPLADVFQKFYEEEIKDYRVFVMMDMYFVNWNEALLEKAAPLYQKVFGTMPIASVSLGLTYSRQIDNLRSLYRNQYLDKKLLFKNGLLLLSAFLPLIDCNSNMIYYKFKGWNDYLYDSKRWVTNLPLFEPYFKGLSYWETDEEFTQVFSLAWTFEKNCRVQRKRRDFMPEGDGLSGQGGKITMTGIRPYWFLKAFHMGLIEEDVLCRALMEYFAREDFLLLLSKVMKKEVVKPLSGRLLNDFFGHEIQEEIYQTGEDYFAETTWIGTLLRKLYHRIIPVMVDTELRRGEAETIFSWDMRGVTYIEGVDYLVRILMALGKDTLGRETYYSWYYGNSNRSKREVLSELLKSCYPKEHESSEDLKKALAGTRIEEKRLVEVAMYAPQWIDILEEYLGWPGLKSGCYYFMAHMNERFDDQKKAIIARYTPLTPEELQDGAFDAAWFEEAYALLGEARFDELYQAAKYISDGQKHSRARKYADAASGKIKKTELRKEISAKRNKDLLMSYGLIPFAKNKNKDLMERYQFIEQFRKESRQFGAQRRASEGKASDIALLNLSVRAGYADVTRLKLTMEAQLTEALAPLMQWYQAADVEVCLQVDEEGQSKILCRKDGKPLKSVPSRLGKDKDIIQLKEAHKNLKEQYRRTKKMMEESMESGDSFYVSELLALLGNPVVRAILHSLVFLQEQQNGQYGWIKKEGESLYLKILDGTNVLLDPQERLLIAHPYHLYQSGTWHTYQKYLFTHKIRQPFKQVFRELYVKIPEELGQKASRMFAGNQIQPKMTVGCLKGRRWVADYEEGLQKVYYKENIVARIYALADWFSPADVEAPTLEFVEFFHRKTFQALTIQEVPELIYSEVMRDVDLAVSVAHAGGVDPETSHSTIEMRRAIATCNLELFGFQNVTLKDSHALIHGSRADYNVHLGSGVVHQEGGAMLHILPVHSQQRGRIFLPFVDEDPKTAEIMSKIILLAEDQKIKDPSILEQIR